MQQPRLVILDEPMSGLDPAGRKHMRELILSLKQNGTTVLFSSHVLSDAEALCDRVAILVEGQLREVVELGQDAAAPTSYTLVCVEVPSQTLAALGRIAVAPPAGGPKRWTVKCADQVAVRAALAELQGCRRICGSHYAGTANARTTVYAPCWQGRRCGLTSYMPGWVMGAQLHRHLLPSGSPAISFDRTAQRRSPICNARERPWFGRVHERDEIDGDARRTISKRALLLLVVLAMLPYANALSAGFTFDDEPDIQKNPAITGGLDLARIVAAPLPPGTIYRPFAVLTFALNERLAPGNTVAYHGVNVLLHAGVAVLVFVLAIRLFGSVRTAQIAAVLFALHPVHTEAVTSLVGRTELLAALFGLAAILSMDRADTAAHWPARVSLYLLSLTSFSLALFSKESALVVVPLFLLFRDRAA